MRWNKKSGYIKRVQAETILKNYLGISTLDYYVDKNEEFIPYYTYIMEYLNNKLVLLGSTGIKQKLEKIRDIFNYGAEKIAAKAALDLVRVVGIETWPEEDMFPVIPTPPANNNTVTEQKNEEKGDSVPSTPLGPASSTCFEIEFDLERFVFAWTGFMTSLWMRLRFQYAHLFIEAPDLECCKCGVKGQDESDYESWSSKIFPHDELYDRSNFEGDRSHSAWGNIVDRYCDCYRKN